MALDPEGRPRLELLQNRLTKRPPIVYFPFDILFLEGRDLTRTLLAERREILNRICPVSDQVILSAVMDNPAEILRFVHENNLEGVIAKRSDSCYEPGRRTGAWQKMRVNLGQDLNKR